MQDMSQIQALSSMPGLPSTGVPDESVKVEGSDTNIAPVESPLEAGRDKVAVETFQRLDKDGSGGLNKEEFLVVLSKIMPGVDEKGVDKAFKKAKVTDLMDLAGFQRWCDKMFKKESDETFVSAMDVLSPAAVEIAADENVET